MMHYHSRAPLKAALRQTRNTLRSVQVMPNYSILHDSYVAKGPFNWAQLKEMKDLGKIELDQEVQRSDMKNSVTLEYALIFLDENIVNEKAPATSVSWFKLIIGTTLSLVGLSICAALIKLLLSDESVGMRQGFIAVIFTFTGGKMLIAQIKLFNLKREP